MTRRKTIICAYILLGLIALFVNVKYMDQAGDQGEERSVARELSRNRSNETSHPDSLTVKRTLFCLEQPGTLVGLIVTPRNATNMTEVAPRHPTVKLGGEWLPVGCRARQKIAIIIPFRDRQAHLVKLLDNLHAFLQRQQLHYRIIVVEQMGKRLFNKGLLFNTGFAYVNRTLPDVNCLVLHDVDLIPFDDRNLYACRENPRHLSAAIDCFNYSLPYRELVGGVLNMKPRDYAKVNGYSNLYWGWGVEDDDMFYRLNSHGFKLDRSPAEIARYGMMQHRTRKHDDTDWTGRNKLMIEQRRQDRSATDGITSLKTKIVAEDVHELYTHLMVDVENHAFTDKFSKNV